jgi:hypothetical protein
MASFSTFHRKSTNLLWDTGAEWSSPWGKLAYKGPELLSICHCDQQYSPEHRQGRQVSDAGVLGSQVHEPHGPVAASLGGGDGGLVCYRVGIDECPGALERDTLEGFLQAINFLCVACVCGDLCGRWCVKLQRWGPHFGGKVHTTPLRKFEAEYT